MDKLKSIVQPLEEFWSAYYKAEYYIYAIDKINNTKKLTPEIKRFNLN